MVTDATRALVVPLLRQQITEVCEKSAAMVVEIIQALQSGHQMAEEAAAALDAIPRAGRPYWLSGMMRAP